MTDEPETGNGGQRPEDAEGVWCQEGLRHVDHEGARKIHTEGAARGDGGPNADVH